MRVPVHVPSDLILIGLVIGTVVALYGNILALRGPLLYDDKAAILQNPVVLGQVPLDRVWAVDFWGVNEVASPASHKSWRPLVTLTYCANYFLHGPDPFGYHVVNCGLHAAVTVVVLPAMRAALGDCRPHASQSHAPALAMFLFAVHPVHVEAVQNIVGRAEVLMSLLYLSGFVLYTRLAHTTGRADGELLPASRCRQLAAIGVALLFTLGATLCKETGITLPLLCAAWDVLVACRRLAHPAAVGHWIGYLLSVPLLRPGVLDQPRSLLPSTLELRHCWLKRVRWATLRLVLLAAGGGLLCSWRLARNGGTMPTFNAFENPAALHPHRGFRALSVLWVWLECVWVCFWPSPLCCDWSYPSLPPVSAARA